MNRVHIRRALIVCAVTAASFFSSLPARAGEMKDNPKYQAWAKFKPGSTNTLSTDIEMGPNKIHLDITRKLVSVTDKEIVVETVSTATVMGHDHAQPATTETIPAQTDKDEIKGTGEKEVEAMGKTFKCKVWEAAGSPDSKPAPHAAPGSDMTQKATVYTSDEVPGGLVKMETAGRAGAPIVFTLSAMESK